MRKGDLVRLNVDICFTEASGVKRRYPQSNYYRDERGLVEGGRPTTPEERASWYASDASKGMTSAGETKLPPQSIVMHLHKDRLYTVLRARARVRLGWGNAKGGYTKVLCTVTGEEVYVKRNLLEVVDANG